MYKVKDNVYRIRDFTSGDNVEESKFIEGTNQRGAPQMQAQVCVLFKDEYNILNEELETLKNEVNDLQSKINDKETQINELEKQIKESKRANIDEVIQLKENISNMKEDHQKEVSHLHQENTNLEKLHANEKLELEKIHHDEVLQLNEEKSQLIQDHLKEINEKDKVHSDEVETIRTSFLNLLTNVNAQDISEIKEIKSDVPSIFKPFMRKTMKKLDELEERKQINTPEKIVKTYELSGEKEKA